MEAPDFGDCLDVTEIHDLADICDCEPRRAFVSVDRDDANAQLSDPLERASLVASGSDEQHSLHGDQLMASTP
jgi:hypothetical protein